MNDRKRIIRDIAPTPELRLSEVGRQLNVELGFRYAGDLPPVRPGSSSAEAVTGPQGPCIIYRHHEAEGRAVKYLRAIGLTAGRPGIFTTVGENAYRFLLEQLPRVRKAGWKVGGLKALTVYRVATERPRLAARIRTGPTDPDDERPGRRLGGDRRRESRTDGGTDRRRSGPTDSARGKSGPGMETFWLELEVAWGDQRLSAAAVRDALQGGRPVVQLADGRMARIPDRLRQPLEGLFSGLASSADRLKIDRARAPLVSVLLEEAEVDADAGWTSFTGRLRDFQGLSPVAPPAGFKGALRPYQLEGLRWLVFLRDYGLGGILADDMGLGKTIQLLALLLSEREAGVTGPSLVIAPSSVVSNWEAEARRFAPSLRTVAFQGSHRRKLEKQIPQADLVITSYALLRKDLDLHLDQSYRHVALDEAQHIKNPASQTAKAARRLRAAHRLALTGTPIENRLEELWSQFSFVMPQLLGSLEHFKSRYILPIEVEQDERRRDELVRRVKPFILRRLKEEVARDLPPRTEAVMGCELGGLQRRLYNAVLKGSRSQVFEVVEAQGMARARMTVLSALLRLRQVCCDPQLLERVEGLGEEAERLLAELKGEHGHRSAKLQLFHEIVREVVDSGHRVLVFSQFVKMLELLKAELERSGLTYEYLDGRTKDRLAKVDRFNAGSTPVFLISLKAGGTGLNLTGADYVVHYDPWWNPAVEAQATDRAHRIGQTRPVFSYKLIARGTIEERMLELQDRKRALAHGILDADGWVKGLTREDLEFLLGNEEAP